MGIEHVQVTTTVGTKEQAEALANSAVSSRLAACVQIQGPVSSTYWWDGEVQQEEEWVCVAKTSSDAAPKLIEHLSDLHPYDNPELIVLPIVGGSDEYLEWIGDEVSVAPGDP